MQSSCEQSSRFVYKTILAPEAQQLLYSIHKTSVPSTSVTAAASTVVRCSTPVTTAPLTARLVIPRQPGCIVSTGQQVKIIVGSMNVLRSLNTCMPMDQQAEEEEMADRSRSPSPPHPIFNGPVVRYFYLLCTMHLLLLCVKLFSINSWLLINNCSAVFTFLNMLHGLCNSSH